MCIDWLCANVQAKIKRENFYMMCLLFIVFNPIQSRRLDVAGAYPHMGPATLFFDSLATQKILSEFAEDFPWM